MPRPGRAAHCDFPMKKTLLAFCAAFALVVSFTGCGGHIPVSVDLELVSLDRGADGNGKATLRFLNRGIVAYNFKETTTRVLIDGKPVGTIAIKNAVGIPASAAVEQSGVFTAEKGAAIPSGTARYQLETQVTVTLYDDNTEKLKLLGSGTVVLK